jgi:hypothetical protein
MSKIKSSLVLCNFLSVADLSTKQLSNDLMMYMCSEKFTLESQQLSRLETSAAEGEGQEALKEDDALKGK